jgi:hypothetical protein
VDELTQAIGAGDWASKIFEVGVAQLQFQNQLKSQKVANAAQTAAGVDGQRASTVADKTAVVQKALPWVAGAAAVLLVVWMLRK